MTAREAEVRVICSYVAGAAGWKEGANTASHIRLFQRDAQETSSVDDLPSEDTVRRMFGGVK